MDRNTVKTLRNRADYLRHLANNAEREYVAPIEDIGDDEPVTPLHDRLREAATDALETARAMENLLDLWEYADDRNRHVIDEAKREVWYDDAYQGFCGG